MLRKLLRLPRDARSFSAGTEHPEESYRVLASLRQSEERRFSERLVLRSRTHGGLGLFLWESALSKGPRLALSSRCWEASKRTPASRERRRPALLRAPDNFFRRK